MLDLKEEEQYRELKKLARKLHIPIPEAFLTLEVFDKDGKLIQRHRQRSHSWVRNAYNLMFCALTSSDNSDDTFEAGKLSLKDTGGTVRYAAKVPFILPTLGVSGEAVGKGYCADVSIDTFGILVGSGTNAESFEDYALQTQIAQGVGAGQLSHVATGAPSKSYAALVYTADWMRYFNNNSGGSIDVNEVALVFNGYGNLTNQTILTSRDKLPSTVAVPDTGQLKVTYTIQLTYPS